MDIFFPLKILQSNVRLVTCLQLLITDRFRLFFFRSGLAIEDLSKAGKMSDCHEVFTVVKMPLYKQPKVQKRGVRMGSSEDVELLRL